MNNNVVIISPSKAALADLTSAVSAFGWEVLGSSKEVLPVKNVGYYFYVSLRKGKRCVRFTLNQWGKSIRLTGVDKSLFHLTKTELIFDAEVFDSHFIKMDEKNKAMKDGKTGFTFKKQLLIPYVEGLLEQNGVNKIRITPYGNKQFVVHGEINLFGDKHSLIKMDSVVLKYADLVDIEFDNYQFDVYTKYFSGRIALSDVITMLNNFNTVRDILSPSYDPIKIELTEKDKEINKVNTELQLLKAQRHEIGIRLSKYQSDFSEQLRKIIDGTKAKT